MRPSFGIAMPSAAVISSAAYKPNCTREDFAVLSDTELLVLFQYFGKVNLHTLAAR